MKKEVLRKKMNEYIEVLRNDRSVYQSMLSTIGDSMQIGKFADYASGREVELNDIELYWVAKAYNNAFVNIPEIKVEKFNMAKVDLQKYFSINEIKEAKNYNVFDDVELLEEISLENAIKLDTCEYFCYNIEYRVIFEAIENGLLQYDKGARGSVKVIDRYYKKIMKDKLITDIITINIPYDNSEFDFDGKRILFRKIDTDSMKVIGGLNFALAIHKALTEDETINGKIHLRVFNFGDNELEEYYEQELMAKVRENESVGTDYKNDIYRIFVRQMSKHGDEISNGLFGKIEFIKNRSLENGSKVVYGHTLWNSIEVNYENELSIPKNNEKVFNYVVEFLTESMRLRGDSYIDNNIEGNIFALYVAWSKLLYKERDWKKKLKKVIESVDWSIDNPIWADNLMLSTREDKRIVKKITTLGETLLQRAD